MGDDAGTSHNPEGSRNGSFRGSNHGGRRPRSNRGRGNGRNVFQNSSQPENRERPSFPEDDSGSLGAAANPRPRGRGRGSGHRSKPPPRNPSDHRPPATDDVQQGYNSYYAREEGYGREGLQRQQQPEGPPSQQGRSYREPRQRNPQQQYPPASYGVEPQEFYGQAYPPSEYYPPSTAGPSRPKQSRGPKAGDQRRGGYDQRPNGQPAPQLEHQPFENIGRQYYSTPFVAPRPPREEGAGRYRREEVATNGRYTPQDVRYQREESEGAAAAGYVPRDRYRREEATQKPPKSGRPPQSQNWRSKNAAKPTEVMADTATQRERLTTQLTNGTYECMVCCESVKPAQPTWSCSQCFHVFHLSCIKRWSRTSQDEGGQWRCPGCQSTNSSLPIAYLCFCSKQKDPEWNRREIPHSCGEVCGKALGDGSTGCTHNCTLLCHPGPCPTCSAQTQRSCPCGKVTQVVKCGSTEALLCGNPCEKLLSCGLHSCEDPCHVGPCQSCPVMTDQRCFCGQSTRQVPCSVDHPEDEKFQCHQECRKKLDCGIHGCDKTCHPGDCGSCQLQVSVVKSCPCGKSSLEKLYRTKSLPERKTCADPVPVCGSTCGRILSCGPPENPHTCASLCHVGPCPPCPLSTVKRCRCGKNEKSIKCRDLAGSDEVLCERRCNKKKQCGRHKCIQTCCIDAEHICTLVCQRPLTCGEHRCEALCHAGNCNRCYRVSFDELRCHCGTQVIYPPVPCGARPPDCNKPCTLPRPCGHPQLHSCHPDSNPCPPCVALCEKLCYGKHELRKNVPCHLTEVSCGKACGKPLKCGRHTCQNTCHAGPCPSACTQPCPTPRPECGHPCALPCHGGPCPATSCKEKIKVQCQCGQRQATVSCEENEISYRKMATGLLASKMAQLQSGEGTVDLKDLLGNTAAIKNKSLECNDECALVERNRRLALALQIKNPNPKPGSPPYPESLKNWAKKDPRFAQMVHDKLTDLVQLAKQSAGKMKSRSYSFDPMNRDKRQFVHEYCAFFGCESMSYDEEPKRNVVATAFCDLSFLPAVGVVDVVRRELGQRKMPGPPRTASGLTILTPASQQQQQQQIQPQAPVQQVQQPPPNAWGSGGTFRTLSDVVKSTPSGAAASASAPTPVPPPPPSKPAVVDYFDFTS